MEKLKPRKGGHSAPQRFSQDVYLDQCRYRLGIFVFMAFGLDHHLLLVSPPPPLAQPFGQLSTWRASGGGVSFPRAPYGMGSGLTRPTAFPRVGHCCSPSLSQHAPARPPSNAQGLHRTPPRPAFGPLLMCQPNPLPLPARGPVHLPSLALTALFRGWGECSRDFLGRRWLC